MTTSIMMFKMKFFTDKMPIATVGDIITSQATGLEPRLAAKLKATR